MSSRLTDKVGTLAIVAVFSLRCKRQNPASQTEAWCIAKIRRLIGPIGPTFNPDYDDEFVVAEHLESSIFVHPDTKLETQFIKVGTLLQELEQLPGPKVSKELIEFIEYLLVVDHEKRPTALEALGHPYLQSLQ